MYYLGKVYEGEKRQGERVDQTSPQTEEKLTGGDGTNQYSELPQTEVVPTADRVGAAKAKRKKGTP